MVSTVLFILLAKSFLCCALMSDVSVLVSVNSSELEKGLIYFRSLWHYNPTITPKGHNTYGHACVSGIDSHMYNAYVEKYAKIRVVLHRLHTYEYKNNSIAEDVQWRNLLCTAQVADYYFMHNVLTMNLLLIGINYMIVADLRETLLDRVPLSYLAVTAEQSIYCMPKLANLGQGRSVGGLCEMDILLMSSKMGTEFYGVLNATKPLGLLASEALEVVARSVSGGMTFFQSRSDTSHRRSMIIRDGRMWTEQGQDDAHVALVEFGNNFHKLNVVDCIVYISFDFTDHFHTAAILNNIFARDMSHLQSFCDEEPLFTEADMNIDGIDRNDFSKNKPDKPAVFDLIIFNDEIELLLLRLEYLKPYVTTHVIVESESTFTGKSKPLHFLNNKHLFSDYNVVSFVLDFPEREHDVEKDLRVADEEVWNREYFSRNRLFNALETLNAKDEDIILVSDVDEIAHPRALETLVALHSHTNTHSGHVPSSASDRLIHSTAYRSRIHKLHQRTYMYDFDCYLPREGKTLSQTSLTATTLGYAKELFSDNNYDSLMTAVRKHQQYAIPYAYEDVLAPGGWHLTFFGGIQRIKSKLSSYSHRNIRRTYVSDVEGEKLDEYGPETEKFFTLVSERIKNGDQIDNRENEKCLSNVELDEETAQLKQMWENVILKLRQHDL